MAGVMKPGCPKVRTCCTGKNWAELCLFQILRYGMRIRKRVISLCRIRNGAEVINSIDLTENTGCRISAVMTKVTKPASWVSAWLTLLKIRQKYTNGNAFLNRCSARKMRMCAGGKTGNCLKVP